MSYKIFIDGKEGTTGLRIADRFKDRSDIEILEIPEEKRKDTEERKKYINASDYTFLCLPDAAAVEAVSLVENDHTKIIDASTAHRTKPKLPRNQLRRCSRTCRICYKNSCDSFKRYRSNTFSNSCICFLTVIPMNTKVVCIIKGAFMVPVTQPMKLYLLGNGSRILA